MKNCDLNLNRNNIIIIIVISIRGRSIITAGHEQVSGLRQRVLSHQINQSGPSQ